MAFVTGNDGLYTLKMRLKDHFFIKILSTGRKISSIPITPHTPRMKYAQKVVIFPFFLRKSTQKQE
jgi:hypothetical protein